MSLETLITFVRSFRGGGLNDGQRPLLLGDCIECGETAVTVCSACRSPLCDTCLIEDEDRLVCLECV